MSNPKHLAKFNEGVCEWNKWREQNPNENPDLSDEVLKGKYLPEINFSGTNLAGADLEEALLPGANLNGAILRRACLQKAKIQTLDGTRSKRPDLRGADLQGADLTDADVYGVKYDDNMKCFGIRAAGCHGDQLFVRHVLDLAYLEGFKIENPKTYWWWESTSKCGRSWWRWAWCSFGLALFFAVILYLCYFLACYLPGWAIPTMEPNVSQFEAGWFAPIYFSIVTFTTLGFGDITPSNTAGQIFLTLEVIVGYIMLGGLVSLISNKMARRS